jgi:hypothetical protein
MLRMKKKTKFEIKRKKIIYKKKLKAISNTL